MLAGQAAGSVVFGALAVVVAFRVLPRAEVDWPVQTLAFPGGTGTAALAALVKEGQGSALDPPGQGPWNALTKEWVPRGHCHCWRVQGRALAFLRCGAAMHLQPRTERDTHRQPFRPATGRKQL